MEALIALCTLTFLTAGCLLMAEMKVRSGKAKRSFQYRKFENHIK